MGESLACPRTLTIGLLGQSALNSLPNPGQKDAWAQLLQKLLMNTF